MYALVNMLIVCQHVVREFVHDIFTNGTSAWHIIFPLRECAASTLATRSDNDTMECTLLHAYNSEHMTDRRRRRRANL